MSLKNSNDTIGNRTRHLPACSALSQPTAPPRASPPLVPRLKERVQLYVYSPLGLRGLFFTFTLSGYLHDTRYSIEDASVKDFYECGLTKSYQFVGEYAA